MYYPYIYRIGRYSFIESWFSIDNYCPHNNRHKGYSNMNKPITEKQHFVPVFYLNRFIGHNKKLCVYDRKHKRFFESSPKDLCYEKMLYETAWVNASEQ